MDTELISQAHDPSHSPVSSLKSSELRWTAERVIDIRCWTPKLFSFRLTRSPAFRFAPGQFARLGLQIKAPNGETVLWRAYSMVSASHDEHLEFFSIVVPEGEFTSRLQHMKPGDTLLVEKSSYGFLTTDRFVQGRDLWLLSSGTGIAPFLSILHDPQIWTQYENLILVHSVREFDELAYRDEIQALPDNAILHPAKAKLHYIPIVTREKREGLLGARITHLIEDGRLEKAAGIPIHIEHSRLMICGNPEMASDLRNLLNERGFQVGRRGIPGQLAFENYW